MELQKCLAKNRQLNRLNIQPCLKAAEPSARCFVVGLIRKRKQRKFQVGLVGCPDIIRFLSGVKIKGGALTRAFYLLSDSEQKFKIYT